MTTNQEIGANLRRLREGSGKSIRFVAKACGISAPFLSDIELGRRSLSQGTASKIAEVLDLKAQIPSKAESVAIVVTGRNQRRFEAAKAALQGLLASEPAEVILPTEHTCRRAVDFADALLLELDRKEGV